MLVEAIEGFSEYGLPFELCFGTLKRLEDDVDCAKPSKLSASKAAPLVTDGKAVTGWIVVATPPFPALLVTAPLEWRFSFLRAAAAT